MVLCKFFQQGYCRFGQGCRFEHSYASKYSYHANSPQQQQTTQPAPSQVSDEQLTAQLIADASALLNGGQWMLTTYTPFTGKPSFPGFMNMSPEEARLFVYEAKANNTLDSTIAHLNNLQQESKSKYENLTRPTQQVIKVIRSIYNGETAPSPFVSATANANPFGSGSNTAASIFKSAAQNTSIFAQPNATPFAQATPTQFQANTSPFAQANTPFQQNQAQSIFAQAAQNVFQQANQPSQQNPASIFASANQNAFQAAPNPPANQSSSIFGNWSQNQQISQSAAPFQNQAQSVFDQGKNDLTGSAVGNVFAQANQTPFQSGQNPGVFAQSSNFGAQASDDIGAYSKQEDLLQEDVEMYMSSDFKLGFVPEMPPPQSLCM